LRVGGVGDNAGVSNPYAPPEDRPRAPEDAPAAPAQDRDPRSPQAGSPGEGAPRPQAGPDPVRSTGPQGAPGPGPVGPRDASRRSSDAQRPVDPQAAAKVVRLAGTFGVLVLASVLVAALPLPWRVASIAFAAAAVVWGVRAWVLAVRTRVRSGLPVALGLGVLVACGWILVGVAWLSFWDAESTHQDCVSHALTVSARQECAQQLDRDVQRRTDELRQNLQPTP
jgi:hypothetical protein